MCPQRARALGLLQKAGRGLCVTVCQAVLGTIDSLQRTLSLSTTPQVKGPGDRSLKGRAEAAPNPVHGARLCDGEKTENRRISGILHFTWRSPCPVLPPCSPNTETSIIVFRNIEVKAKRKEKVENARQWGSRRLLTFFITF